MKYIVLIKSSVTIDAEKQEEAIDQINEILEDVRKRNCGNIDDEILANAEITKVKKLFK